MFSEGTPWHVPRLGEILPTIVEIAGRYARQTILARFIPTRRPAEAMSAWRDYYAAWLDVTRERLDEALLELVPPLSRLVPPARVLDKRVNSAFNQCGSAALRCRGIDTLVITGGETDVCVLATVMAAIDHGFRIVLPTDALCSTQDSTRDALLQLYRQRFSHQVEATTTANVIDRWRC